MLRRAILLGALGCAAASCFLPTYEVGDATATATATATSSGPGATSGGGMNTGGAGVGGGAGGGGGASTGPTMPTSSSSSAGAGGSTTATLTTQTTSPRSLTVGPGILYWIDDGNTGESVIEELPLGVSGSGTPFYGDAALTFCSIDAGSDFVLARTTTGEIYKVDGTGLHLVTADAPATPFGKKDHACQVSLFPGDDGFAFFQHKADGFHAAIQKLMTPATGPAVAAGQVVHQPGALFAHEAGRLAVSDVGTAGGAGAYAYDVSLGPAKIASQLRMKASSGLGLCSTHTAFLGTVSDTFGDAFTWPFAASHTKDDALLAPPVDSIAQPLACDAEIMAYGVYPDGGVDGYLAIDGVAGGALRHIEPAIVDPCSVAIGGGNVYVADCVAGGAIYQVAR